MTINGEVLRYHMSSLLNWSLIYKHKSVWWLMMSGWVATSCILLLLRFITVIEVVLNWAIFCNLLSWLWEWHHSLCKVINMLFNNIAILNLHIVSYRTQLLQDCSRNPLIFLSEVSDHNSLSWKQASKFWVLVMIHLFICLFWCNSTFGIWHKKVKPCLECSL